MVRILKRDPILWSAVDARRRLAWGLSLFAFVLLIPVGLLVRHAYQQLEIEAFYTLKGEADDLANSIDRRFREILEREEQRNLDEYLFLNLAGVKTSNFVQLSPLSDPMYQDRPPGTIGYFQLSPDGDFSSPLLPNGIRDASQVAEYGIDEEDMNTRRQIEMQVLAILKQNRIATTASKDTDSFGLATEDNLSPPFVSKSSKKEDFEVLKKYTEKKSPAGKVVNSLQNSLVRTKRKVQVALPDATDARQQAIRVETFEGEIDPIQFSILPSGHAVLFRKVWKEGKRYIQGAVVATAPLLADLVRQAYQQSSLSEVAAITIRYQNENLARYENRARTDAVSAKEPANILLSRNAMSAPFDDLELFFSIQEVAMPASVSYVQSVAGLIVFVIALGVLAIFFAGRRQIALTEQQRDFVSAVSHELKTPLTSIRMYGEMLKEGWAPEEKKKVYYDFIFSESERLSRLIANVLQLARLSRGQQEIDATTIAASDAFAQIQSILNSQAAGANYVLHVAGPMSTKSPTIRVDMDSLIQVFVNLVDNAIKFSKDCQPQQVDLRYSQDQHYVKFSVRDYGPGIPSHQLKKIFQLFYRAENELIRTSKGTGIGLALVQELVRGMDGSIDVRSEPGNTEFTVTIRGLREEAV